MPSEQKVNILLVDDRPENLLALEAILSSLGQNLVQAHSGKEALKLLLRYEFAVILLDAQMPEMDGFETAALIREREKSQHTPIIFLTAIYKSDPHVFKGYSLGAVDYILKPFEPEVLKAKVRVFIDLFKKTQMIKELNEGLERRILERTAELEAANRELRKEISERRRAEAALRESEERYRLLMENVKDYAIFMLDPQGRVDSWNLGAERILGYAEAEVLGQPFARFFTPEEIQSGQPEQELQRAAATGRSDDERWHVRKDGTRFWAAGVLTALRDENGNLRGFAKILRDSTERKWAEEERSQLLARAQAARAEAEAAEERVTNILESITDGFVALDKEWRFTYLNREAERFLQRMQRTRAELIGKNIWEVFPELVGTGFYKEGTRAVAEQVTVEFEDFYSPLNAWIAVHAYPAKDGLSVYFRDVTRRKQAEEERAKLLTREQEARKEAEAANRIKDEFLAVLSHELRTPLTAMLGWARMLRAGHLDEATAARALESIERNAKAQNQLIEDLLDVSRIITGKLRLDARLVDLAPVIEMAIDAVRPAAEAKGIRLETILDPRAGPIWGDPDRVQQIAWNLLSNAIKFTPRGGRVQVRLGRVKSHIEITVSDTGQGISPDLLPYVFDRFRQADSSTTRKHGGLGLGLAIVRHLVELHGGTVRAESQGEGRGATFTVQLPLAPLRIADRGLPNESITDEKSAIRGPQSAILYGLQVLVVDDDGDARAWLTFVLEQQGAGVTTVASAAEALAALERSRPDVLVSDIGMPYEDGYDLIRKIRALAPEQGGGIPAVALTAYARVEDRMRVFSEGYQVHMPKPVEPAELITVIASLVGRTGKSEQPTEA